MSTPGNNKHAAASAATERREVVVVGGGQAGLAIGYFLAVQKRNFTILEAAEEPAATCVSTASRPQAKRRRFAGFSKRLGIRTQDLLHGEQ